MEEKKITEEAADKAVTTEINSDQKEALSTSADTGNALGKKGSASKKKKICKKSKEKKSEELLSPEEKLEKRVKKLRISLCLHRIFTFINFALIAVIAFYVFTPQLQYFRAKALIQNGKLDEGVEILESIADDYGKAAELYNEYKFSIFGTEVIFGSYEQDGNESNGAEPLEWIVLESSDGMALITTKYSIDCRQYKDDYGATTWKDSDLRTWLNNRFIEKAFTNDEKSQIVPTQVEDTPNVAYGTKGGETTLDKVFLLSAEEFNKYLAGTDYAIGYTTQYARNRGAISGSISGTSVCWLRTAGESLVYVSTISYIGELNSRGVYTYSNSNGFRPVIWVMTENLE